MKTRNVSLSSFRPQDSAANFGQLAFASVLTSAFILKPACPDTGTVAEARSGPPWTISGL